MNVLSTSTVKRRRILKAVHTRAFTLAWIVARPLFENRADALGVIDQQNRNMSEAKPGVVADLTHGAVVLAAGPWTPSLVPHTRGSLAAQPIPLRQARTVACDVSRDHPVVRFPEIGAYVRPESGGYLFGAFEPPPGDLLARLEPEVRTSQLGSDPARSAKTKARLARWIPALGATAVDHCRQGWTTFTPDGLPLAGRHAELTNLWVATGCGAMGFVWASSLGRWLAQSIVEDRAIPVLAPLDPARFGRRALDPLWVRDEGVRRHVDYYGMTNAWSDPEAAGPSAEHYACK